MKVQEADMMPGDAGRNDAGAASPRLEMVGVSKTWRGRGREVVALDDVSFELGANEFVCLTGASGCGKTTMLNIAAGLENADTGQVRLDGNPVRGTDPRVGMVFQRSALFPWLTVKQNIGFGLRGTDLDRAERKRKVEELAELVGLEDFQKAYPRELSGGMAQRVAVARALARSPEVLLMDEPFGALDAQTRESLQHELLRIWQATNSSIVFVTHSVQEAVFLADRIIVMAPRPGCVHAEIEVSLERPRSLTSTEFGQTMRNAYDALAESQHA